jgi:serine/threonine protein kinase
MCARQVLMCPEKSHPQENKERALLAYGAGVDAWAAGVLAYELVVGHPPFERETRSDTVEQIMCCGCLTPLPHPPYSCSQDFPLPLATAAAGNCMQGQSGAGSRS